MSKVILHYRDPMYIFFKNNCKHFTEPTLQQNLRLKVFLKLHDVSSVQH